MMGKVNRVNLMRLRCRTFELPEQLVEVYETRVHGWPVLVYAQAAAVAQEVGYQLTCFEHGATTLAATKRAARTWARNVEAWCPGCQAWAGAEEPPIGRPVDTMVAAVLGGRQPERWSGVPALS